MKEEMAESVNSNEVNDFEIEQGINQELLQ